MNDVKQRIDRLVEKTSLHAIQVELQEGYNLSPVEAQVLGVIIESCGLPR
jgi:hypothetical protein